MEVFKCDRCGKIFEKVDLYHRLPKDTLFRINKAVKEDPYAYKTVVDLCPSCMIDLGKFMKGGSV